MLIRKIPVRSATRLAVTIVVAAILSLNAGSSFSDDAALLGRPTGFRIHVREVTPSAGAGFVVAKAGNIMTMPGLGPEPSAMKVDLRDGEVSGLF